MLISKQTQKHPDQYVSCKDTCCHECTEDDILSEEDAEFFYNQTRQRGFFEEQSVCYVFRSLCCEKSIENLNKYINGEEYITLMLNTQETIVQGRAGEIFIELSKFDSQKYLDTVYKFIISEEINNSTIKTMLCCVTSLHKILKRLDEFPKQILTEELLTKVNLLFESTKANAIISSLGLIKSLICNGVNCVRFNYKKIFSLMSCKCPNVKQKAINVAFIISCTTNITFSDERLNKILEILIDTIRDSTFKEKSKAVKFLNQLYLYSNEKVIEVAINLFGNFVDILRNECSCIIPVLSLIIRMTVYSEVNNCQNQLLELFDENDLENVLDDIINYSKSDMRRSHALTIRSFIYRYTNQD